MIKIGMLIADRYEILEKTGTGGMSVVYRAKDHKLNRIVAVKVLKQEFSDNANFVSKFRVEAQAAAGLMHPNIVNVYDVGDERGMYYIVMEFVDGITLKKYIEKKSSLTTREAISIAIQVSMGLQAAHANHVIHRDIKPQNIMISRDGKVKVTDFGIAKAATSNTITSNVMGSVHYTSPEQARGGYSDERSDIYSLGITLFEMLTGRVPFNGETTVAIAIKHIQSPMPSPREYMPDVPVSVEQIVLKCCEKSPDRRYQNMTELIEDLKQSLIHPDDNFVRVINPDEDGATRMADDYETARVRRARSEQSDREERYEEDAYADSSYREDSYAEDSYAEDSYRDSYEDDYERPRRAGRREERYDEQPRRNSRRSSYDDDYYEYEAGKNRRTTVIAVLIVALIAIVIIVLAATKLGVFSPGDDADSTSEVEVAGVSLPAMTGVDLETVKASLNTLGLSSEVTYEESDTYDSGIVISAALEDGTVVTEGTVVDVGTSIVLTVSTGQSGVELPDVVGYSQAEAIAKLKQKGFDTVNKVNGTSNDVEKGEVYEQDPEGGTTVPADTTVTIYISTGPSTDGQIQVPDVTGITVEEAMAILVENSLTLGSTSEQETDDPNLVGVVISQSVEEDSFVDEGTEVDLVVGVAAEEEEETVSTYSYTDEIAAPTAEETSEYVSGTQVYVVVITSDGQTLLNTTTTSFPYQTGFTGITCATGTLKMSFLGTSGEQVIIERTLTFDPES